MRQSLRRPDARPIEARRDGKSLIEALVIISMMSLIMGLAATSLASLFRLRYVMVRDTEQAASLDRLAMRVRLDAHDAASAVVDDDCILKFADGRTIRYSFSPPRVVREVRRDDELVHRDTFSVPLHSVLSFTSEPIGNGSMIRMALRPEETKLPPRELPRWAVIEAAMGIHGKLAKAGDR